MVNQLNPFSILKTQGIFYRLRMHGFFGGLKGLLIHFLNIKVEHFLLLSKTDLFQTFLPKYKKFHTTNKTNSLLVNARS